MDSSNQTQNNDVKETQVTDFKDIISTLHESTLGQILSFLPTIEAIQTCVLSQRWIHVWKSITSLCFSDSLPCYGKIRKKEQFVNFVNKVLLHHLANSSINNFSLCLTRYSYDSNQVREWISTVLDRRIQNLHIQYPDVILLDSSSVCDASVVIVVDEDKKDRVESLGFQAHKLLSQIHRVEQLKLLFYKVLMHSNDIFTHLPTFGRLTYLQLNEVTDEALLKLLHNSPILNTLVLLNGVSHDSNKDAMTYASSVPHCFLSSLRVFQFNGFNVHEHEISLAKFVMANAAVLERMIISAAFWLRYSDIDMEKVKENIFSFPKCCSRAITEFSDVNGSSTCSGPLKK